MIANRLSELDRFRRAESGDNMVKTKITPELTIGTDRAYLEKPFGRDALIRKVREVLDSRPPN